MEASQVFRCGQCKYECVRAHIDSSSPEEIKLWQDIDRSEDAVRVTCPQCKTELIQCRYCPFNLCKKDKETHSICTQRKVSILYLGKEHVKNTHNNTDNVSKSQTKKKRRRRSTGQARNRKSSHGSLVADDGEGDFHSFTCCRCRHVCRRGDTGEYARATWELISTQGNDVAQVVCPGCKMKIIQCCKCSHNINPEDPETIAACGKERTSASRLVIKRHVKKKHVRITHPSLPIEDNDGEGNEWADLGGLSGGDIFASDEVDARFRVEEQDRYENMHDDGQTNDGGLDGSHRSMSEDDLSVEDCVSDDEVQINLEAEAALQAAQHYVDMFTRLDIDPNEEYEENEENLTPPVDFPEAGNDCRLKYTFEDFIMFDNRREEDKTFKRSKRPRVSQNQLYMYQSYCSPAGGFRGLVGRSNKRNREDRSAAVGLKEAMLVFLMFKLVMDMTLSQQEDFVRYQKKLLKHLEVEKIHNTSSTRIPDNMAELKATVTIGANSILKNFPSPKVFEIGSHACVELKESILLLLGHGGEPNFGKSDGVRNLEGLNGSKAMENLINDVENRMKECGVREEIRKETKIGHLIFWSDSFLRCFIKQKENSVWILTVTVCPPENKKSSGNYTIILAIGKSSEDHTEVVESFMKQANELMEGFDCYLGSSKTMARISFGTLLWCADRPEAQSLTHTMKEGIYGKVAGWSVNPSEEFLPACVECYKALIGKMLDGDYGTPPDFTCESCCNWSFETNPTKTNEDGQVVHLQEMDPGPAKFPKSYPDASDDIPPMPQGRRVGQSHYPPVRLSTEWMRQSIASGYFGVRSGKWSKESSKAFFQSCNIKGSTSDMVIEKALQDRKSNVINPSSVQPQFWSLVNCFGGTGKFPVLPMHGVCHGMIPDVLEIVMMVFAKYKKKQKFYDYANPIIKEIEYLRLSYCKVRTLPKAAWISENSMGFMRIMPYLIGTFLMNNHLGTSEEAKEITLYIKCFLNAFQGYVSILMSETPVDSNVLDCHIKLFMSSAHYLHKKHGKLDSTKKNVGGPGEGRDKRKFLDRQEMCTVEAIANELGVSISSSKHTLIGSIRAVRKDVIQENIEMSDKDASSCTKEEMYEILYERIAKAAMEQEEGDGQEMSEIDPKSGQKKGKSKGEGMCWNKGYWLSFMANIVEQISYLGVLRLIWSVLCHEKMCDAG